jgi:flagellar basal body rod protein FlgB
MLFGFIDRVSSAASLKEALDASSARTRAIASRVANATAAGGTGFALPGDSASAPGGEVNLEQEMTSLADEQLRYAATASLLQKTYQQIRDGLQDH